MKRIINSLRFIRGECLVAYIVPLLTARFLPSTMRMRSSQRIINCNIIIIAVATRPGEH